MEQMQNGGKSCGVRFTMTPRADGYIPQLAITLKPVAR